jgi:hypothetical protein
MLKLMLGLAAVVVVVLVIVLIAARTIRAEAPEEPDEAEGTRARPGTVRGRRADQVREPDPRRGRGHPAARESDRLRRAREYADPPRGPRGHRDDEGYRRGARPQPARNFDDHVTEQWRPDPGERDRLPSAGRRPAHPAGQERELVVRQSGRRRSADSDQWSSTEWEKLSDVDYWAELSAEKPLSAQPEAGARPGALQQRGPAASPGAGSRAPARPAGHPGDLVPAPIDPSRRAPASTGSGPLRAPGRLPPPGRPAGPPAADDDPLTSPSFPRIPAIDGRSYGSRRSAPTGLPPAGGPHNGYHAGHRSGPVPVPPRMPAGVPGNPYGSYVTAGSRDPGSPSPAGEAGLGHDSGLAFPASYPGPGTHATPGYLPGPGGGYYPDPGRQPDAYPTAAYGTAGYVPTRYPSRNDGQPGRDAPHHGRRQPGHRV